MEIFNQLGFKEVKERIIGEKVLREDQLKRLIKYNHPFLEKVLGGIFPGEIVLLGGDTGTGKSELAKDILLSSAKSGYKSFGIFLEADNGEMETRWKYNALTRLYYNSGVDKDCKKVSEFRAWKLGKCTHLDQFEEQANEELSKMPSFYTFYKDKKFTMGDLKKILVSLDGKADLIVLDHIHYMDLAGDNENKEIADIMGEIRMLAQVTGIAIIIIAHLRKKQSGEVRGDIPTLDDFHGTSSLQKIANTAILFGSGGVDPDNKNRFITYIQAAKVRGGGKSRTSIVGRLYFNTRTNLYDRDWDPGQLTNGKYKPYETEDDLPGWWNL